MKDRLLDWYWYFRHCFWHGHEGYVVDMGDGYGNMNTRYTFCEVCNKELTIKQ